MAHTLVERVRFTLGASEDDFFDDETIKGYLNASQQKVVSYMIKNEIASGGQTMRALDKLRIVDPIPITGAPLAPNYATYMYADINVSGDDAQELIYLTYKANATSRPLRVKELTHRKLFMLDWGNIKPSTFEAYYYIADGTGLNTSIRIFAADMTSSSEVVVTYIQTPSVIETTTTTLVELPAQFTNAVVYGAAVMLGVQEQRENVQNIMELYKRELQTNAF